MPNLRMQKYMLFKIKILLKFDYFITNAEPTSVKSIPFEFLLNSCRNLNIFKHRCILGFQELSIDFSHNQ